MFVRFVTNEFDMDSHVPAGLFCAAFDLVDEARMYEPDYAELNELWNGSTNI